MGSKFSVKKGDLLPKLRATLRDGRGSPLDLTTATGVAFRMRATAGGSLKIDLAACAVIAPATAGVVEYTWAGTDTDTVGDFDGEFIVTWPGGPQTVPASGYVTVSVGNNLA